MIIPDTTIGTDIEAFAFTVLLGITIEGSVGAVTPIMDDWAAFCPAPFTAPMSIQYQAIFPI